MSIRLWPQDYERKDHITHTEKELLRNATKTFQNGHFAVGIDPVGMSKDNITIGMYISPSEGLVTFSIYPSAINIAYVQSYIDYVIMIEDIFHQRLLDSKQLIVRNGNFKVLKFPYKHIIIFSSGVIQSDSTSINVLQSLLNYAAIGFFKPIISMNKEVSAENSRIFEGIRKPYDTSFNKLSDLDCRAIFERLAPEYVVISNETENIKIAEKKGFIASNNYLITGQEVEYKTFFLDEYQVAQVNDMGKGHRVILANPGAGKSVLLLAKAFKYSSLFKKSKILLTCYNSNLADSYNFKKNCANFVENKNLYIMTFHKLVKKIYEDILKTPCEANIVTVEEINSCIELVKRGRVNLKFKAIFIDEVQIFDPLYLELCYLLLDKDEDNVFLMAGDLNQAVRALSRRGDAPWKRIKGVDLDFAGRVRYIEKNYRNSKEIGEYISNMLIYMNSQFSELDLINKIEYEYNSFTISSNPTIALKIKTGIDRYNIKTEVVSAVINITKQYGISYSDIAILFPYKQHKSFNYFFSMWVEQALNEKGIPFSAITSLDNKQNSRKRYSDTTGVVLSTIDSSLGLDFKAVIFAGLYPYSYVFNENGKSKEISSWNAIRSFSEVEQQKVQSQMRAIYTACSRAREILYVLSDIKLGSPMEDIIKERNEIPIISFVKIGDSIKHKKYGKGIVSNIDDRAVSIIFEDGGMRMFVNPDSFIRGFIKKL